MSHHGGWFLKTHHVRTTRFERKRERPLRSDRALIAIFFGITLFSFCLFAWHEEVIRRRIERSEIGADPKYLFNDYSPTKGDEDAPITIVEFIDPASRACAPAVRNMKRILSEYEGKVRFVIRYMPFHGGTKIAASLLEEAREQGRFEEGVNLLLERQGEWANHSYPRPEVIPLILAEIGMAPKSSSITDALSKHGWKVDRDESDGEQLAVQRTPTIFVNGRRQRETSYDFLKASIQGILRLHRDSN